MNFGESRESAGRARNWRESIEAVKAAHPAKGAASAYLMSTYGVSRRTAQKWLAGSQAPAERGGRRDAVRNDKRAARKIAADQMRSAKVAAVGKVEVQSKSVQKPAGARNVGVVTLDPQSRQMLNEAAALLESGMDEQAAQKASDAIMRSYGLSKGDNGQVSGALEIRNWSGTINFMG